MPAVGYPEKVVIIEMQMPQWIAAWLVEQLLTNLNFHQKNVID